MQLKVLCDDKYLKKNYHLKLLLLQLLLQQQLVVVVVKLNKYKQKVDSGKETKIYLHLNYGAGNQTAGRGRYIMRLPSSSSSSSSWSSFTF